MFVGNRVRLDAGRSAKRQPNRSGYADEANKETQVKYYFDPATYLLKQIVSGNNITQTETFDDYRKVGGITVAFAATHYEPANHGFEQNYRIKIQPAD